MSAYKDSIVKECHKLSKNKKTVFIGYNTSCGSRIYGTLRKVPPDQCIETPVAENLMVGLAMGMSLEGCRPVLCFERTNFLWAAADAIRHHLCMLPQLSGGQFDFPVVLRAITGHDKPLDPGPQHHTGNVEEFAWACGLRFMNCESVEEVTKAYREAEVTPSPLLIIEHKRLY